MPYNPMLVTFRSLGKSKREWQTKFDLGSDDANMSEVLRHAWNHNAEIIEQA